MPADVIFQSKADVDHLQRRYQVKFVPLIALI